MKKKITKENYREWVAQMEDAAKRVNGASHENMEIYYARGIGNMHREFGNFDEARPYYERAVSLARTSVSRPLESVAFLYWHAGDLSKMEEECRSLIAYREKELPVHESSPLNSDDERRKAIVAYGELATAAFLLRDYETAAQWAATAIPLQRYGRTGLDALPDLARGLKSNDREQYEKGLRVLRGVIKSWPTFESDSTVDLYRVALSLSREYFGSIPADLEAELVASGTA